jgi:hypothetical protein
MKNRTIAVTDGQSTFSQEGRRVQSELAGKFVINTSCQMEITIEMQPNPDFGRNQSSGGFQPPPRLD